MARSHGGLTTKVRALVDAGGLPIALTGGQAPTRRSAAHMLCALGPGQILIADCNYDSDALRQTMTSQGAWADVRPFHAG